MSFPYFLVFLFTGKQIIHPGQIDIVNKAFSPSEEKLKWASDVVTAFEEQEKQGKVSGIDKPRKYLGIML